MCVVSTPAKVNFRLAEVESGSWTMIWFTSVGAVARVAVSVDPSAAKPEAASTINSGLIVWNSATLAPTLPVYLTSEPTWVMVISVDILFLETLPTAVRNAWEKTGVSHMTTE